jgi:hypothetical protein
MDYGTVVCICCCSGDMWLSFWWSDSKFFCLFEVALTVTVWDGVETDVRNWKVLLCGVYVYCHFCLYIRLQSVPFVLKLLFYGPPPQVNIDAFAFLCLSTKSNLWPVDVDDHIIVVVIVIIIILIVIKSMQRCSTCDSLHPWNLHRYVTDTLQWSALCTVLIFHTGGARCHVVMSLSKNILTVPEDRGISYLRNVGTPSPHTHTTTKWRNTKIWTIY